MNPVVAIHLAAAFGAVAVGIAVAVLRKGTRLHKALGRTWMALMFAVALTSLWIPAFLHLSWIHIFTLTTLVTIPYAWAMIRRGNLRAHRIAMLSTFAGLVGAGIGALIPGRIVGNAVWGTLGLL